MIIVATFTKGAKGKLVTMFFDVSIISIIMYRLSNSSLLCYTLSRTFVNTVDMETNSPSSPGADMAETGMVAVPMMSSSPTRSLQEYSLSGALHYFYTKTFVSLRLIHLKYNHSCLVHLHGFTYQSLRTILMTLHMEGKRKPMYRFWRNSGFSLV